MSTNWDYEQTASPYNDTKVDSIQDAAAGEVDQLPSLTIDIPDTQIIKNLDMRIEDSRGYWDNQEGYDLKKSRGDNQRLYLGKQQDVRSLYRFQLPYVENQIYIAMQSILAYVTAQAPQPEVSPAQDTPQAKQFALDLEKVQSSHSLKVKLTQVMESTVKNALIKRIGLIYLEYDPNYGRYGEIVPVAVDPDHVIIDKNARMGDNPAFICRVIKMSVNEMCNRWPDKKEEIYKQCGIVRGTYKQLEEIIVVRQVWLTHYKDYEPEEACVYYFGNVVLEKDRNPNWLYVHSKKNFLDAPIKPFIPLNFDNDGSHWIDQTSAVEQAGPLQNVFNKRGRQIMEVADKANGMLIVSSDSGITKADLQDLTGDPNQKLIIKTGQGMKAQDMVWNVPPPEISPVLMQDKIDLRTQIQNIMGAPTDFTGSDSDNTEDTLGQSLLKKNQAQGRQDLYVRAIDRMMFDYYNLLTQMMVVWYTDKHLFVYNGGDGEFDHIVMSRDLIDEGISVNVKAGTSTPPDKQRAEAIALQLLKVKGISLLDAYKQLHMPDPQKLYDNWAKSTADPMSLARDTMDELDESKAYIAYVEIMNGKKPKDPDDCNKEFVLTLRKLMLRDEFLKAGKKVQTAFLKYVDKAISSLELRTSLDIMSQEGLEMLKPEVPIQPPAPPMMPGMGAPMGQPPMGGMPPPPGGMMPQGVPGQPIAGAPPQAAPPMPGQGAIPMGNVTNGTPMMNPGNPQTPPPGDIGSLPTL